MLSWVGSPTNIVAIEGTDHFQLSGSTWSKLAPAPFASALSATSANNVWTVVKTTKQNSQGQPYDVYQQLHHYDGSSWTVELGYTGTTP